jgi:hypothetical protein
VGTLINSGSCVELIFQTMFTNLWLRVRTKRQIDYLATAVNYMRNFGVTTISLTVFGINGFFATFSKMTFSTTTLGVPLCWVLRYIYRYAEHHHAECYVLFIGMLNFIRPSVIMLNVVVPKLFIRLTSEAGSLSSRILLYLRLPSRNWDGSSKCSFFKKHQQ